MEWQSVPTLEPGVTIEANVWYEIPVGVVGERVGPSLSYLPETDGVVLVGGANSEGPLGDVFLLDCESLAWRELKSASFPARYEHAAIGVRDRLVVFGGARAEGPLSDTWRYNFGKEEWSEVKASGNSPSSRTLHAAGVYKEALVVFGGGERGSTPVKDLQVYKLPIQNEKWEELPVKGTPPSPRQGHSCCSLMSELFVFGGMSDQEVFGDLFAFSFDELLWKQPQMSGRPPCPRAAHGCVARESEMFVFGGLSMQGPLNDLHVMSKHGDVLQWSQLEAHCAPSPRLDMGICRAPIRSQKKGEDPKYIILIYGGVDTNGQIFDDCYAILI